MTPKIHIITGLNEDLMWSALSALTDDKTTILTVQKRLDFDFEQVDSSLDAFLRRILGDYQNWSLAHRCLSAIYATTKTSIHTTIQVDFPEMLLHPEAQLELGDFFIEEMKKGSNTFVLKTYSEHIILRLLRRIREGSLNKDDVQVHVASKNLPTMVIPIDDEGEFTQLWPSGFFDERRLELY